ncbi:MAG: methyltransferase domain-containing protein [Candidatus Hydrogenedentes bacterium]|nr:methyltransferase domain-containing protein [Candidatus Hydrogenedentota bacterium]
MSNPKKQLKVRTPQRGRRSDPTLTVLGPVPNLEEHVSPEWWSAIFNSLYLKTDADVVDDHAITRHEIDLFSGFLNLAADERILDLCCGQGRHSLELARRGFKNVEGFDRSHYLIQRAKATAKKEGLPVKFKEGDARKLPFPNDTFDVIMVMGNSFGYFETVQDDLRVLKEMARVLKPWGRILVDVTDGQYIREHYQPRSWEWIDKKHFVCRERALSADRQRLISRAVITQVEKGVIADQFYAERLYTWDSLNKLMGEAGLGDVVLHTELTPNSQRNQDLEDEFYTIDQLKEALRALPDYQFTYLNNHDTMINDLRKLALAGKMDFVMNLCDEGYGNDPRKELHIPALLEKLDIPYTGGGPQCLAYCYDKSLVRGVAKEMGIPVPEAVFIKPEDTTFELPFGFPVIVKPNFGDSSFGITQQSVANNLEELLNAISGIRETLGYDKPMLVEEFLPGKDLSMGIIGNPPTSYTILPITEEDYSAVPEELPRICGYEAKWSPTSPYWNIKSVPAVLPDETEKTIEECCIRLSERLECRDYTRFDWRLDAEGNPKLLEVNPNPGWCWDGHLAKMARYDGISYTEMLEKILKAAEERMGLQLTFVKQREVVELPLAK